MLLVCFIAMERLQLSLVADTDFSRHYIGWSHTSVQNRSSRYWTLQEVWPVSIFSLQRSGFNSRVVTV